MAFKVRYESGKKPVMQIFGEHFSGIRNLKHKNPQVERGTAGWGLISLAGVQQGRKEGLHR